MAWKTKFVVLRPEETSGLLVPVYEANEFKDAQYWLRYIAQIDDALFQTPLHPACSGSTAPRYKGHKVKSGSVELSEQQWSGKFGSLQIQEPS